MSDRQPNRTQARSPTAAVSLFECPLCHLSILATRPEHRVKSHYTSQALLDNTTAEW